MLTSKLKVDAKAPTMMMRFAVASLLLALSASSAIAADHANAEVATLVVDVDIVTNVEDGLADADMLDADIVDGHKLQLELQSNSDAADGSKGTHYGDPAEGCMKDEVSWLRCIVLLSLHFNFIIRNTEKYLFELVSYPNLSFLVGMKHHPTTKTHTTIHNVHQFTTAPVPDPRNRRDDLCTEMHGLSSVSVRSSGGHHGQTAVRPQESRWQYV